MYRDHGSPVHTSISHIVERNQWHCLRENLARDLHHLPFLTFHHLRHKIPVIQEAIQAADDEYIVSEKVAEQKEALYA